MRATTPTPSRKRWSPEQGQGDGDRRHQTVGCWRRAYTCTMHRRVGKAFKPWPLYGRASLRRSREDVGEQTSSQ